MPGALDKVPAAVRPTVEAALTAVREVAPQATEIPYKSDAPRSSRAMWKLARFAVEGENVVGVGTFPDHANLYFYRGRDLDDRSGLLRGGGKEMRSITLRSPSEARAPEVRALLREAFKLAR